MSAAADRSAAEHAVPVPGQAPTQPPEHAPAGDVGAPARLPAPSSSRRDAAAAPPPHVQARIAVVLYDMLLRGANAEPLSSHLSRAYPAAACLARQYAQYARQALLVTNHARGAHGAQARGQARDHFVLGRVSVPNIAWFCFFVALLHGTVRLLVVFAFFFAAIMFSSTEKPMLSAVLSKLFTYTVNESPYIELFKWLTRVLSHDPVIPAGSTEKWKAAAELNDYLAASLLFTPLFQGVMAFLAGATLSMLVNSALSIVGGIRLQNGVPHED